MKKNTVKKQKKPLDKCFKEKLKIWQYNIILYHTNSRLIGRSRMIGVKYLQTKNKKLLVGRLSYRHSETVFIVQFMATCFSFTTVYMVEKDTLKTIHFYAVTLLIFPIGSNSHLFFSSQKCKLMNQSSLNSDLQLMNSEP